MPTQLQTIIQSLSKAFQLVKPKSAAIQAFKTNLIYLLNQLDRKGREENVINFVETIFKDSYSKGDYQEPENSSPVCFANASGLREGFEEPLMPEQQTPSELDNKSEPGTHHPNRTTLRPKLQEAIYLTKSGVMEILKYKKYGSESETTVLEKHIDELVYQLYELTPAEIAMVERRWYLFLLGKATN